jgi:hypothetical protein
MDLEQKANYYQKLVSPTKDGDTANCSEAEYRVYSFFKKKRQEQMRPVLLSLIAQKETGHLSVELYEKTISFLYNFYVCYSIIGSENSNRLTDIVYKYAAKINEPHTDETVSKTIGEFVDELRKKLPSESMFINAFKNVGWSHHDSFYEGDKNKTRVQTVLEILERYHNYGNCIDDFTIEHILPDSESRENGQIGNLLPLETGLNRRCEDKSLQEKLQIYAASSFRSTRNFEQRYKEKEFDPNKRTEFMAKEFYQNILKL